MRKLTSLLAGVCTALVVSCGTGQAAIFSQSDFAGVGNFGTITGVCANVTCTEANMTVNMAPNVLLQTGIVVLLATPVARVFVSILEYAQQRDWKFTLLTAIVLVELLASAVAALIFNKRL